MDNQKHYRSFFWPTLLIGVGLVWLLVNLGVIAPFNVGTILRLWPLLLIVLGLDILFGHRYAWIGSVLGLLAVVGVVGFLIVAPRPDVNSSNGLITERFSEPVGDAMNVNYNFETASEPVEIHSLGTSNNLIDANLTHYGTIGFNVSGSTTKNIHLYENTDTSSWLNWNWSLSDQKWDIGLRKNIVALAKGSKKNTVEIARLYLLEGGVRNKSNSLYFFLDEKWIEAFRILYAYPATKQATSDLINDLIHEGGNHFWPLKEVLEHS